MCKTYRGRLFAIFIEGEKYGMGFEHQYGYMRLGDEKLSITKELREESLKFSWEEEEFK
ncbi:hypothetical protein O3822_07535 [Gemella sanguinis]|uniref:hypothetical protein n=1 Tax=Gemella sanguinis TaxID=84135 RepID=UPI00352CB4E1